MKPRIIELRAADGRTFEVLIRTDDGLRLSDTCIERLGDGKFLWLATAEVLPLVGREAHHAGREGSR
jgi:hypothetical protein